MAKQDNKPEAETVTEQEVKTETETVTEQAVKEKPKEEGGIKIKYNGVIKTINAIELPTWKKNGWETV